MSPLNIGNYVRTALARLGGGFTEQEKHILLSVSIARAIAQRLNLPTTPAQSAEAYFAATHDGVVCEILSAVNENVYINIRVARDTVFKLFELRYNLVFNASALGNLIPLLAISSPDLFPQPAADVLRKEEVLADKGQFRDVMDGIVHDLSNELNKVLVEETAAQPSY